MKVSHRRRILKQIILLLCRLAPAISMLPLGRISCSFPRGAPFHMSLSRYCTRRFKCRWIVRTVWFTANYWNWFYCSNSQNGFNDEKKRFVFKSSFPTCAAMSTCVRFLHMRPVPDHAALFRLHVIYPSDQYVKRLFWKMMSWNRTRFKPKTLPSLHFQWWYQMSFCRPYAPWSRWYVLSAFWTLEWCIS